MRRLGAFVAGSILALVLASAAFAQRQQTQTSTLPSAARSTFLKLTEVQKLWEQERYDEAIAELEELAPKTEGKAYDFALTYQYLAHTNILAGRPERARPALERALSVSGLPLQTEADLRLFYGQVLAGDEEFEMARDNLEFWLENTATPPQPSQIFYVAYANYQTGNIDRARPLIERTINEVETPNDTWNRLYYQILFDQKQYDDALYVLKELLARNVDDASYWRLLVNHHMQREDGRAALTALAIAYLQGLLDKPDDLKRLISMYGYVEIPEKAARLLEEYMQDETLPSDPDTLRQLGDLWLLAREREKAKGVLQRAAAVAPDGRTYQLLGGIFFEDEQWRDAHASFVRALELGGLEEPDRVQLLAGICAYRAGMRNEARAALEAASKSDALRSQAESFLARLDDV